MTLALPWPPSVNHYWQRNRNGGLRVGDAGVAFRGATLAAVRRSGLALGDPGRSRLRVALRAFQPDKRRRDLDNLLKATLDALAHAGVYEDDAQIDELVVVRAGVDRAAPRIEVSIVEMEPAR